jgi:hypothetical protein
VIALALITVAGYLFYAAQDGHGIVASAGLGLAAAGGVLLALRFVLNPLLVPIQARRLFRQTQALHETQDVTWDDDTLILKAATWSTSEKWTGHPKRKEGSDHFLLYINDLNFRLIPKRAFPDDASRADFARLFNEKIKPA